MAELNRTALERATKVKIELEADEDEIALADKIIAESKRDGYRSLSVEESESDEYIESDDQDEDEDMDDVSEFEDETERNSRPKRKSRGGSVVSKPSSRQGSVPVLKEEELAPLKMSSIKLMAIPDVDRAEDQLLNFADEEKSLFYDGHEGYFEQQKLKNKKPGTASMAMAPELTYEEYDKYNEILALSCKTEVANLNNYYRLQFSQWAFELQQGFGLAFYGVGSKRLLVLEFLQKYLLPRSKNVKCLVVNGYNPDFRVKTLLTAVQETVFGIKNAIAPHIHETLSNIKDNFNQQGQHVQLVLLINNIDGDSLRTDRMQQVISELAGIPQIQFVCTIDNISTPLFWNSSMLSSFNFVWHNLTTYLSYKVENGFKDPLGLGKSNKYVGSKGVKYVLSSLTSNAKNLYRMLILQQLEKIDLSLNHDDLAKRAATKGSTKYSLLFTEFYQHCLSEFITSNEISFRTVLGEFVEHKMCTLTKNSSGAEILYIPFTVDEMEKLLEDQFV
ncbi:hypothetical protein OGAPHI_003234 [Ogataea philodendri]|uniref:Origin recognition complex subunit 2 n=1 Tax=Ogataea philodendri TaxID=1378263 RepID=A0A9P8T667_9ASCO|nr:uncharacterized protein OGAPHI_003234 [Ogataea philodendri]KAH3666785.1 hypothetical protein OGAPHI_003234 [Ogataea philodendri]